MDPAAPPPDPPPPGPLVATEADARAALARFSAATLIGLDTETAYDPAANAWRLALVQLAVPDATLVLDPLAVPLELLRPVLASPAVRLVAHNARFDEGVLVAAGLQPVGLVDTLRLSQQALALPAYGLADVTAALFGVALDKTLQKSNWRRRPLTREQLAYAAADPWWSLRVYEALRARLEPAGAWDAALAHASLTPRELDPEGAAKPRRRPRPAPDAPPLGAEDAALLARLKQWRAAYAQSTRTRVYMVCPDRTLEQLARERPATLEALTSVHGLGDAKIARFGAALLAVVRGDGGEGGG